MDQATAVDLATKAIGVALELSLPLLVAGLIVGLLVSLFQALTQIQEMTLTFVPKLVVLGLVMLASLPMIGQAMSNFTAQLADRIISG